MVDFVKLITAVLYQHSNAAVQLDTPLHCVKSPKEMHAIRVHAVMVHNVISNHCTNMVALVHKDILVSPSKSLLFLTFQIFNLWLLFFAGKNCEKQNLCASSPCNNGGTCISSPGGDFKCQCTKGFQGRTCSEDVEECHLNNPCRNGGTCRNTLGSYQWVLFYFISLFLSFPFQANSLMWNVFHYLYFQ